MNPGFNGITGKGGGGLAGRPLRRVHMRAVLCPSPFCISFSVLPVYNEGKESLCHMTELSSVFHAGVALFGATAVKGSPILL